MALTLSHLPPTGPPRPRAPKADPLGQVLCIVGLVALAGCLNEAGTRGWTSPLVLTALGLGIAALTALYFQQERGFNALATGLALLPSVCMGLVAAPLFGRLAARTGPYVPMAAGLVLGAVGFLGWLPAGPHTPYPVVLFALAATGLGQTLTAIAATAVIIDAAPATGAASPPPSSTSPARSAAPSESPCSAPSPPPLPTSPRACACRPPSPRRPSRPEPCSP